MSTRREQPIDGPTLAGRGIGALAIARWVNFTLSQNLVKSTELFR
ncbi:MAG: hypothetical protein J07HX64_01249 [halophilic archaeon J07HX64]|nr:MAG: hypothetical protein J07HX64_01249 [halophilic archaeon J07HX64]